MRLVQRVTFVVLVAVHAAGVSARQAPPVEPRLPAAWLQGWVRTISGDTLVYPWAYPGQTRTLLSRATDGKMAVEWEGAPVPDDPPDTPITYLWHAGTASGNRVCSFAFSVNGTAVATFTSGRTTADRTWRVEGPGGATLTFLTTRIGQFDELFGFMWFTAPRSFFGAGAPRFSVVGEAAGDQDYYLGQEQPVETWTRVRPEEAVFANGQRAARVSFSLVGPARTAAVRSRGRLLWSGPVHTGHTTALVPVGPNAAGSVPITVDIDGARVVADTLNLSVVPPRALHLLPHSHVDIGYSDPQPEVERKQWKNLRDAIDLGRRTQSYPRGARFKWNVEGLWAVESYLAQATPAERQAFAAAVKDGIIGLQANYTNILTGLATPSELRHWTDAARRIERALGTAPARSAMHSDIPGLTWSVVPALARAGVRYFSSGPNYMPGLPDGGDRIGGTLKALGDKPFWWTSPSGRERLLFWMSGRGYSWFHGLNTGPASDRSRDSVLEYVQALADAGYPYDMIQVRYTIGGDNGPVDPRLPDYVRRWNDEFASPRLVIDTADAMFEAFARRHGAALPVRSGDMTPYWEDGALSSAAEEALTRAAARRVQQAEDLAAMRGIGLPPGDLAAAWRSILLWHEHTWGAADSISQPDRPDVVAQWEYKKRFATEADRLSRALMDTALTPAEAAAGAIEIVNSTQHARSGLVWLSAEASRSGDRVVDAASGAALPSQRVGDGRLAVWVDAVAARGSRRVRIVSGEPAAPAVPASATLSTLDNGRIRLALDTDRAGVLTLSWAGAPGHDFSAGAPGIFRCVYVDGRDPAAAVASTGGRAVVEDAGPLVATIRIESPAGGTAGSTRRFSIVAGSDKVFAELTIEKLGVRTKESAHVAFPFNVPQGVIRVDQGDALVEIERDQLPGSCRDFAGVQSAIDVSNGSLGVSLVSLDAPLIELGAITDERQHDRGTRSWRERVVPGATLYAYLLNNYWHTNYKADQSGPMRFRFVLRPHGPFDARALRRLSDEQDYPLLAAAGR
jgi:hypothetical protein